MDHANKAEREQVEPAQELPDSVRRQRALELGDRDLRRATRVRKSCRRPAIRHRLADDDAAAALTRVSCPVVLGARLKQRIPPVLDPEADAAVWLPPSPHPTGARTR